MPRDGAYAERKIHVPVRLEPEHVVTLDRWAAEGGWSSRNAMLSSMVEDIINDSEGQEL